jgi:hypothetical protein
MVPEFFTPSSGFWVLCLKYLTYTHTNTCVCVCVCFLCIYKWSMAVD